MLSTCSWAVGDRVMRVTDLRAWLCARALEVAGEADIPSDGVWRQDVALPASG